MASLKPRGCSLEKQIVEAQAYNYVSEPSHSTGVIPIASSIADAGPLKLKGKTSMALAPSCPSSNYSWPAPANS